MIAIILIPIVDDSFIHIPSDSLWMVIRSGVNRRVRLLTRRYSLNSISELLVVVIRHWEMRVDISNLFWCGECVTNSLVANRYCLQLDLA